MLKIVDYWAATYIILHRQYRLTFFHLTGLDLSHNRLSALPDDLSNLTLLVDFNLSSNLFQLVPSVLMQMASLKHIDLSSNNINHASKDELCSMFNLETMDLRNNPLNDDIKEQLVTSLVDKVTIS